ncbi:unnamed protein product [Paramecium pentaurelia]|uniref:Insulin-like growth factor binding protein, N-terminal n=1 Tax=Paramecium pentaurelia TaxID=43138 RepID=A0A8S1WL79_9CILI|nr:unnamed protein product [Paramecium pentaurelia]
MSKMSLILQHLYWPTSDDCLTCNNIGNIEIVGSTCRCPSGLFYNAVSKSCSQCHSSCQTCFQGTFDSCLSCDTSLNRILKGLQCVCSPGYYELNSICTNCPDIEDILLSTCYKLCTNNQQLWHTITCNSCDEGFHLIYGECQPICGDLQIYGYEQCEDNNTLFDDLCFNCQFQCPAHCLTCDESTTLPCPDVCGDGMITGMEECEDGNTIQYDGCFDCKFQCQLQCTKCIKGQCFECNTGGWYVDPTVQPWICKERCGDQLIVGQEQCDDGNQDDTDGCKNCKYFCRIGCSSCNYNTNKSLSCELPGFFPQYFYCKNYCGDGFVVKDPYGFYSEECDDGNNTNSDGCNNYCRFQCQPQSICINCVNNRCEQCAPHYLLSDSKICIPICGDQIIVPYEQCEVPFILPYKGCQNCQAKCQSSCITCDNTGLGCKACKNDYNRIDNLCYSICGDKIVTEDEECDDGNLKFGDGCHQCSFSCPVFCSDCRKGVCYDCHEGYYLLKYSCFKIYDYYPDPRCNSQCLSCSIGGHGCSVCQSGFQNINGTCTPICGDKLVVADEQCDDGNIIFEDGCHVCSKPCSCSYCFEGICFSCPDNHFLFKNQCFNLVEQANFKETTNFQFSDLSIIQTFKDKSTQTSRIHLKIDQFEKQVYNQVGQYIEIMDKDYSYINIQIIFQCSQNKKVKSQFSISNYENGTNNQENLWLNQCHQTVDHTITYSFRLEKVVLKDEIMLIQISEDELILSILFIRSPQKLLQITLVDI